ncbi:hypothetical protein HWV62_4856 [Athelia sp. TMB]|nr:hypothetical protein HWV62_4856 [Athelia sp. TMB]
MSMPHIVGVPYASWSLAERVLVDPLNEDSINGIFDRLELVDAMAVGATCRRGRSTWLHYRGRVFNMNKFLTLYIRDAPAFREMLNRNGSIKYPLTILTGARQASVLRRHLETVEGFEAIGSSMYWRETRDIGEWATSRGLRPARMYLRSVYLSPALTKKQEFPIRRILGLEKTGEDGRVELEAEGYDLLRVREGRNTVRALGDDHCWTLFYDGSGNNIANGDVVIHTQEHTHLEGNRWYMRVDAGKIVMEVEAARLSGFEPYL